MSLPAHELQTALRKLEDADIGVCIKCKDHAWLIQLSLCLDGKSWYTSGKEAYPNTSVLSAATYLRDRLKPLQSQINAAVDACDFIVDYVEDGGER